MVLTEIEIIPAETTHQLHFNEALRGGRADTLKKGNTLVLSA